MDYREREDNAVVELDKAISNFVNGFGYSRVSQLAEHMVNDHPTLQQSKMRLFVAFVREMAKVNPDGRNEASVKLAKGLVKEWGDGPALPTI